MRAKALKAFRDKDTGQTYARGSFFEGTEERIAEINAHQQGPFLCTKAPCRDAANETQEHADETQEPADAPAPKKSKHEKPCKNC